MTAPVFHGTLQPNCQVFFDSKDVMDIYLTDPSEVPLPPEEVRIRQVLVNLLPDGKRVLVHLELAPSQRKPNLDLVITNSSNRKIASASIIESINNIIEVVMHIPEGQTPGSYSLKADLYFFDQEQKEEVEDLVLERQIVDTVEKQFSLV